MKRSRVMAAGAVCALLLAFGAGLMTGVSQQVSNLVFAAAPSPVSIGSNAAVQPSGVDFTKFWEAWSLLQEKFVQTHSSSTIPTDQEKVYGAIKGLAESYGDPYTVFFPPKEAQEFNENISGAFEGVGMELGVQNGALTVVAPLKGTPAEKAGVRSGDVVVAIDGKPSRTMAVDDAIKLIRGPKGTKVTLTVERAGAAGPLEIPIVRDTISIPLITTKNENGVFVIELYSFSQNSGELFRNALREFFESGSTKLILDLRGNPGGYLESAVSMASFFLPVGEEVVTEDFQGKQENFVHRSFGYNVFANKKLSMAILVNEGSASASEILAGALQQHGIAKLVGTRTFGKGSVQQLLELGGGAEIKITVARWLTPNGSSISDGGLKPDIEVKRTADDVKNGKDPQKDAAKAWLATQ